MLVNSHLQKDPMVKRAQEVDYFNIAQNKSLETQYFTQIEQLFKEADDNNNGVFDFEEFKIFMEKKSDWENIQYGGSSNFTESNLKLIFDATQHEYRGGVTLDDIKRKMKLDKWLIDNTMKYSKYSIQYDLNV